MISQIRVFSVCLEAIIGEKKKLFRVGRVFRNSIERNEPWAPQCVESE